MNPQEIKKLENKILDTLKKSIQPADTIIAGISGGPDSVFLLHLLKKLPIKIIVAHVNHQLRKEADADQTFVAKLCTHNVRTNSKTKYHDIHNSTAQYQTKSAALTFASLTADIKSLSQKRKQGLEETGRKVRYDFFKKLAKKYHAKFIITAHHADDNLETIILNFARGAGLQGLGGMREIEQISLENSQKNSSTIFLLRPLLQISKKQILELIHFHKLQFRVDKSNDSLVYKRNFIRHKIVPLLKEINPGITDTLAKNTENIREINEFLKSAAENWLKKYTLNNPKNSKKITNLDAKNFRTQPQALQKIILLKIYQKQIGNIQNLKSINLTEILSMIEKNIGNKKKKFGQITISIKNNIISLL